MEVGDLDQAERVKAHFLKDSQWQASIWLDSAGKGRVVIAVKSEKWAFLLPQPDYTIPLDLSPFPRQERPRRGESGSIISSFRRPALVDPPPAAPRKRDKEKDYSTKDPAKLSFVDRMIEKLRLKGSTGDNEGQKTGFIKYLEDLKKISK